MSDNANPTPVELEKQLDQVRDEIAQTINSLTGQLSPQYQAKQALKKLGEVKTNTQEWLQTSLSEAKEGNYKKLLITGGVVGGTALVLGFTIYRRFS